MSNFTDRGQKRPFRRRLAFKSKFNFRNWYFFGLIKLYRSTVHWFDILAWIVQWLDSINKTVSVYPKVHWLDSVCPTIQWTDVRWWESKILAFGQWSVQLYVTKLVFYRQEKNCTKKGLQNCCTIIKASSVKNVKKHAHLVEKFGCDQIMLWDSFRLSGPLGAIFQTPWEVQRRVSKFHTIYMSIRSDQKLYTK